MRTTPTVIDIDPQVAEEVEQLRARAQWVTVETGAKAWRRVSDCRAGKALTRLIILRGCGLTIRRSNPPCTAAIGP